MSAARDPIPGRDRVDARPARPRTPAPAPIPPRPGRGSGRYRGPSLWTAEILLVALVAAIVLVVLLALAGLMGTGAAAFPG